MAELKPGWTRVAFGELAACVIDRVDDPKSAGVERYVGLEHLDADSLSIRRWGTPNDVKSTKLRFKPLDIIFAKRRAYQRKLAVATFEGICSAHAMVLRAKPGSVLREFLPFFMQSDTFMERAIAISVGSLSPTINWKTLAGEVFSVPPRHEQERIVARLAAIDRLVHTITAADAAARTLRQAYLESVFSRSHASVGDVTSAAILTSGGTPNRTKKAYWTGNIPWLSPKDMKTRDIFDTEEHLSREGAGAGARIVPSGSLFIVVRGMILAHTFPICRAAVSMAFNQDVRALTAKAGSNPRFLEAWLEWAAPRLLRLVSTTTHGTKRLELDRIRSLPYPILPADEQARIAERWEELFKTSRRLGERLHLLARLRRMTLAKAFDGTV